MKRILLIASLLFVFTTVSHAQVKFGLGAVMGTKAGWEIDEDIPEEVGDVTKLITNYGINARILWEFNDKINFTGGLTYYFPSKVTVDDLETNYYNFVVNANAHYNLLQYDDKLTVYGLAGFNMSAVSKRINSVGDTNLGFGIQAGAGVKFWKVFAEGKYDANLKQVVATVGIYL